MAGVSVAFFAYTPIPFFYSVFFNTNLSELLTNRAFLLCFRVYGFQKINTINYGLITISPGKIGQKKPYLLPICYPKNLIKCNYLYISK